MPFKHHFCLHFTSTGKVIFNSLRKPDYSLTIIRKSPFVLKNMHLQYLIVLVLHVLYELLHKKTNDMYRRNQRHTTTVQKKKPALTADQRLCFRSTDACSIMHLLPLSEISNFQVASVTLQAGLRWTQVISFVMRRLKLIVLFTLLFHFSI